MIPTAGKKRKWLKRSLWLGSGAFVLMNVVAALHAYKFTHFGESSIRKTKHPETLSFPEKLKALCFGISNPRPLNTTQPAHPFETLVLQSNRRIEGWYIPADSARGTVILCHGYSGYKSAMLDKAELFRRQGYSTFLFDFMGSGGSEGSQTTIGYHEAQQVCSAFRYVQSRQQGQVILFGTSMGAAAIMKATADSSLPASGLILECPFGSMTETVEARFRNMKVPAFPMAYLLLFWGGVENGFNAFAHKPAEYAKAIKPPVLLMYGEKDLSVSRGETDRIYRNLPAKKSLRLYAGAGHENYLTKYREAWTQDVSAFLGELAAGPQ